MAGFGSTPTWSFNTSDEGSGGQTQVRHKPEQCEYYVSISQTRVGRFKQDDLRFADYTFVPVSIPQTGVGWFKPWAVGLTEDEIVEFQSLRRG